MSSVSNSKIPDPSQFKFKTDRYQKARGTPSMLKIFCLSCQTLAAYYQKDGKGRLLRCYKDRFHYRGNNDNKFFVCSNNKCNRMLGKHMIYKPEKREAFRLLQDAFYTEKIVSKE